MHRSVVLALLAVTAVVAGREVREARAASIDEHAAGHAIEVRRIQAHFDSVLVELGARDVSRLTPDRRQRRSALIATLSRYRDRGVFPHNRDFPGEAVPYFIDRPTGTLCAVAYLLESTGRRDIVDRVAAMNNNVWVAELARDRKFETWLDGHGLTLAEAARVQVPYMIDDPQLLAPSDRVSARTSSFAIGGAAVATLWNGFANRSGHQGIANFVGAASGVAAAGFGIQALKTRDTPMGIGAAAIAAGTISALLATRGFLRHRQLARDAKALGRVANATVTPIMPVSGQNGAGLSVSIRF